MGVSVELCFDLCEMSIPTNIKPNLLYCSEVRREQFGEESANLAHMLKATIGSDMLLRMYGDSNVSPSFDLYHAFVEIILAGVGVRCKGRSKAGKIFWRVNKVFMPITEMFTVSDEAWALLIFMNSAHVWEYDVEQYSKNSCYSPKIQKGKKKTIIDQSQGGLGRQLCQKMIRETRGPGPEWKCIILVM